MRSCCRNGFIIVGRQSFSFVVAGTERFLLQFRKGKRVLIDPYLSDSLDKKYAATDKPHTRMSELSDETGFA